MPLTDVLAGDTPGASLIIWRKSRPFMGRSATVLVFTTPTRAVDVVSRVAAVAETSTTCCCCATPNCRSRFVVLETATSTLSILRDSKPACKTVIVYWPTARSGKRYWPCELVLPARVRPVEG